MGYEWKKSEKWFSTNIFFNFVFVFCDSIFILSDMVVQNRFLSFKLISTSKIYNIKNKKMLKLTLTLTLAFLIMTAYSLVPYQPKKHMQVY